MTTTLNLDEVAFDNATGTVVVVTQDAATGRVLMVAHADREALARTIETGEMHYRSRSRGLWRKGATSGNVQRVVSLDLDCDRDTVLARVVPAGQCAMLQPSGAWSLLRPVVLGQIGDFARRLSRR